MAHTYEAILKSWINSAEQTAKRERQQAYGRLLAIGSSAQAFESDITKNSDLLSDRFDTIEGLIAEARKHLAVADEHEGKAAMAQAALDEFQAIAGRAFSVNGKLFSWDEMFQEEMADEYVAWLHSAKVGDLCPIFGADEVMRVK